MTGPIRDVDAAVAELGALPMPVGSERLAVSGPICSEAEARAAGLDIAPSVEELDAMASTIVAAGDPLSAEVSLAQAVPLLGAAVTGLRARLAELEAERDTEPEQPAVFRAAWDTELIEPLYAVEEAARAHCVHDARLDYPDGTVLAWRVYEETVAVLVVVDGDDEEPTGYTVTRQPLATEHVPLGDEAGEAA